MSQARRSTPVALLVCLPADRIPETPAVVRPCARCRSVGREAELWVAHDMVAQVDAGTAFPLCPSCVDAVREQAPHIPFDVAAAQTGTLAGHGALGWADQLVTDLNNNRPGGPYPRS